MQAIPQIAEDTVRPSPSSSTFKSCETIHFIARSVWDIILGLGGGRHEPEFIRPILIHW